MLAIFFTSDISVLVAFFQTLPFLFVISFLDLSLYYYYYSMDEPQTDHNHHKQAPSNRSLANITRSLLTSSKSYKRHLVPVKNLTRIL